MNAVDDYLEDLPDDRCAALQRLREIVHRECPGAVETISYNMPTFKLDGQAIGGFLSNKNFLSWYPHSGRTLATLADQLGDRSRTSGALHFTVADPLPEELFLALLRTRQAEFRA